MKTLKQKVTIYPAESSDETNRYVSCRWKRGNPLERELFYAQGLDEHFVLFKQPMNRRDKPVGVAETVGVAHTIEEVDERLRGLAKQVCEEWAKQHCIELLFDWNKGYERLPSGGK